MGAGGPWSQEQIDAARAVRFSVVLDHLSAYYKLDPEYSPLDPGRRSKRVHVGYQGHDFRFIFTGDKFVNELMPEGTPLRGGGGAIDFVRHVTGLNFVQAVKVCLDALSGAIPLSK
jgi:hypothetical protein